MVTLLQAGNRSKFSCSYFYENANAIYRACQVIDFSNVFALMRSLQLITYYFTSLYSK